MNLFESYENQLLGNKSIEAFEEKFIESNIEFDEAKKVFFNNKTKNFISKASANIFLKRNPEYYIYETNEYFGISFIIKKTFWKNFFINSLYDKNEVDENLNKSFISDENNIYTKNDVAKIIKHYPKNTTNILESYYPKIERKDLESIGQTKIIFKFNLFSGSIIDQANKFVIDYLKKIVFEKLKSGSLKIQLDENYTMVNYRNSEQIIEWSASTIVNNFKVYKITRMEDFESFILETCYKSNDINLSSGGSLFLYKSQSKFLIDFYDSKGAKYIPTPKGQEKRIINVKNSDDYCALWALVSWAKCIYQNKTFNNIDRTINYADDFNKLLPNFLDVKFPIDVNDVPKFNNLVNKYLKPYYNISKNIHINLYDFKETKNSHEIIGYEFNKNKNDNIELVDLLLLENEENKHFCVIKNYNALVLNESKNSERFNICRKCGVNVYNNFEEHIENCNSDCFTYLPDKKEAVLTFKNFHKKVRKDLYICADFESCLEEIENENENENKTKHIKKHIASYICVRVFSKINIIKSETLVFYTDSEKSCANKFLDWMNDFEIKFWEITNKCCANASQMTYENSTQINQCKLCNCNFSCVDDKITTFDLQGEYYGQLCKQCNKKYVKQIRNIPIYFHNFKGYDSHFIISNLDKSKHGKIRAIFQNSEKMTTMSYGIFQFVDSYLLIASSLESAVQSVKKTFDKSDNKENYFKNVKSLFPNSKDFDCLFKKQTYAYDFAKSMSDYNKGFPTIEEFYDSLNNKNITQKQYEETYEMYNKMGCKSWGEYTEVYCILDVLLLADVLDSFSESFYKIAGLEILNYITAPSFSYDSLLNLSNVKIDLLHKGQEEIYNYFENSIRGGMSFSCTREIHANNKYMSNFNKDEESSYIQYLDMNSLYPSSMIMKMPVGDFKFEEISFDWMNLDDNAERGCYVQCDIHFPKETHEYLNDYPLCPYKRSIQEDELSPYCNNVLNEFKEKGYMKGCSKSEKLVTDLKDKIKYFTHYRNLKLYVSLGAVVTKVHKIVSFVQSDFMKDFINKLVEMRKTAKECGDECLVNGTKLMMNSCFGKFIENIRKRQNIRLIDLTDENGPKMYRKVISSNQYKGQSEVNDNIRLMKMRNNNINLDKPIFVGNTILELSKLLMYNFYYNTLKKKYGSNMRLIGTDTDSIIYYVKTEDIFEDTLEYKDKMDFSEYPKEHMLYSAENCKQLGKMKDESNGRQIKSVIFLKAKCYSIIHDNEKTEKKVLKGIKKNIIKDEITYADYKACIDNNININKTMNNFKSSKHEITTITMSKSALNSYDDKRYICDDKISTLAYGHYSCIYHK